MFIGCQLEKGREGLGSRVKNLREVHELAFQVEEIGVKKGEPILFDDYVFLVGNMNTNVSGEYKS